MKRKIKKIVQRPWELLTSTPATWDKIASVKISKNEVRNRFVFPWIMVCVLTTFIFKSLYSPNKSIETGFINSIISTVTLFGAYFLSKAVCFWYLRKHYQEKYSVIIAEIIVGYSFTVTFIIEIITTILPGLFYLQILNIYTAYLIWEACRAILQLNEDERGNIVLVFTSAIILSPLIINKIIHLMLPNA
ncbi:MAG: hypothetical protein JZU53_15970 [Paludibacter sp.]|nr:hypothetical protein [Paludibacter sp.]